MDLYVPNEVDESPGIVVVLHYCTGTSEAVYSWFQSLADQHGFLLIAPDVGAAECWNATPARTGEAATIVRMVEWTIEQHDADPRRVFAAGASSGACMTNALLAAYPDVFAAGSVLAGVPAGAWTSGNSCNGVCSNDPPNRTPQQWGDIVRNAYPGYTGPRPRVQLFHGTADMTLRYSMLAAEVAQWTNVLGLSDMPTSTEQNVPKQNWTRTNYADDSGTVMLQVSVGQGVGHDITSHNLWTDIVAFFGLDQDPPPGGGEGGQGGQGGSGGAGGGGGSAGGPGGGGGDMGGSDAGMGGAAGGAGGTTGGTATGGAAAGGTAQGGTAPGGAGGMGTGGMEAGGTAQGGAPTGGSPPASTGGSSTGGATSPASGGVPGAGGTVRGTGTSAGSPSSAAGGTPGGSASPPSDDGGCALSARGATSSRGALALFAFGAAGLFLARRRARS